MRLIIFLFFSLQVAYSKLPLDFEINTSNFYITGLEVGKQIKSNKKIVKKGWNIFYGTKDSISTFSIRSDFTSFEECNIKNLNELNNYSKKPKYCLKFFSKVKIEKIEKLSIVRLEDLEDDVLIFGKNNKLLAVIGKGYNLSEDKFQKLINSIKYKKTERKDFKFYIKEFTSFYKQDKLDSAFESLASAFIIDENNKIIKDKYKKLFERKKDILEFYTKLLLNSK